MFKRRTLCSVRIDKTRKEKETIKQLKGKEKGWFLGHNNVRDAASIIFVLFDLYLFLLEIQSPHQYKLTDTMAFYPSPSQTSLLGMIFAIAWSFSLLFTKKNSSHSHKWYFPDHHKNNSRLYCNQRHYVKSKNSVHSNWHVEHQSNFEEIRFTDNSLASLELLEISMSNYWCSLMLFELLALFNKLHEYLFQISAGNITIFITKSFTLIVRDQNVRKASRFSNLKILP